MNNPFCQAFLAILEEELVPALGCTEPIAIAYAAAKAKELLGCFPEQALLECSGNIIKNVNSVTVPNSGGLTGLRASLLAGLVGGVAREELQVLASMTAAHSERVRRLLLSDFGQVRLLPTDISLHLVVKLTAKQERVTVEIKHRHLDITLIEKNGRILFQADQGSQAGDTGGDRSWLTVKNIYEFSNSVSLDPVRSLLDRQISCNLAIAEEGLRSHYGVGIGRTILELGQDEAVKSKMKAYAAAASEARMSGCGLPVVTNSGSGNQGIAASVPVIIYAREHKLTKDQLYRGLLFSNLLTIHQKTLIGRLSAFCGAVSAACSSGAALTYLAGGSLEQIGQTITNMLANVAGIVCDGAKPSCAAKIASCLDAAYLAHVLAMKGRNYPGGTGIVKDGVEETIAAVGRMACRGMRQTDREILAIMLEA